MRGDQYVPKCGDCGRIFGSVGEAGADMLADGNFGAVTTGAATLGVIGMDWRDGESDREDAEVGVTDGVGNLQQVWPAWTLKAVPVKATVNSINRVIFFIMVPFE